MSQDAFYTVSELNLFIKDVLSAGFPQAIWVTGELQNFNRSRGKAHAFFEIVEKDKRSQDIVARANLVIFANRRPHIDRVLKQSENAFELKDDIEVKFLCKLDFYSPHGAIRLVVEDIDPVYTLGKVAQERQKLIALLTKNGVLEKNKQLPLPLVPLNVGLVTAFDSAAYNDFLDELKKSGFGFKLHVFNALMQGKNCENSVEAGIRTLLAVPGLDVLVISRGGGSIADLSCFDSQKICEAIAGSPLPVLTGIGHEINVSVTDLAAHTYAKTPTAVAQFLIQRVQAFKDALDERGTRVVELARDKVRADKDGLRDWALRLQSQSIAFFKTHTRHLIEAQESVRRLPLQTLKAQDTRLESSSKQMARTVQFEILQAKQTALVQKADALKQSLPRRFERAKTHVRNADKLVTLASPVNTLKRGFSVTRAADGKVVRRSQDVKTGDTLVTHLFQGHAVSEVRSLSEETP